MDSDPCKKFHVPLFFMTGQSEWKDLKTPLTLWTCRTLIFTNHLKHPKEVTKLQANFFFFLIFVLSECILNLWDLCLIIQHQRFPCLLCVFFAVRPWITKWYYVARVPCSYWKALLLPVTRGPLPYSGVMCCEASLNPGATQGLTFPAEPTTAPAFCFGRNTTVASLSSVLWLTA